MREELFSKFPEGRAKDFIRWTFYKLFYKRKVYTFKFDDNTTLKAYSNFSEAEDYKVVKGYFKYYKLKKGDIIADCGAHIGIITLYAANKVGHTGRVIAFEPDKMNFRKLQDNIKLNKFNNIILVNKGVWSKNTVLPFFSILSAGSSFVIENTKKTVKVPVVSIDSELKKHNINRLDFVKMDIEGAEIEAVKGTITSMKKNNVNFAIASYHMVNDEMTCFELEKFFKKEGYKSKTGYKKHLTTWGWK
jgi:FkbM family methyltransferase